METEALGGAVIGQALGPITIDVSAEASDRYWRAAGIDAPARDAGLLFPPMAANLTILLFQTIASRALLHTKQRLVCHRAAPAGVTLTISGVVQDRYERRGRDYAVIDATIALPDGEPLWSSTATFTEAKA